MSTIQLLSYRIIEVERNWNFEVPCNNCGKACYFNAGVYNTKTGKRLILEEKYFPTSGFPPKPHHGCMLGGVKEFVIDGKVLNAARRKLLYKPLSIWEENQIILGRIEYQKRREMMKE